MHSESQFQQHHPGQEIVPGYTLVHVLGAGMEGEVWRARAAGGTPVAIKIVRSLSRVGGRKQLKALKTLRDIRHVNLCPLHCFWTRDGHGRLLEEGEFDAIAPDSSGTDLHGYDDFMRTMNVPLETLDADNTDDSETPEAEQLILVMGLGECTLHNRLIQVRSEAGLAADDEAAMQIASGMTPPEIVHYLRGAADAIDTLNRDYDLFHCDIKPQNILVVGGGAQVCDFGLANKITGALTKTQAMMFATLAYAAPEVLRKKYSRSVDQYSLATTYFELRTGLLPFDITTEADVTLAKCTGKLDLRAVPKAERKVLKRALNVDPEARYESCTAFVKAIALASGVDSRPFPWLPAIAVTCALMALTGLGVWKTRPGQDDFLAGAAYKNVESIQKGFDNLDVGESINPGQSISTLHSWLSDVRDAMQQISDPSQREIGRQLNTKITRSLTSKIETHLSAGNPDDSTTELVAALDEIEAVCGSPDTIDNAPQIMQRILSARLQIALLDGEQSRVPKSDIDQLRMINKGAPSLLNAVCLALLHDSKDLSSRDSLEALKDVALANNMVRSKGRSELPKWCVERWDQMQETLIPMLEATLNQPHLNADIKDVIRDGWPGNAREAKLREIRAYLPNHEFDNFKTELEAFTKQELGDDEETKSKTQLLGLMRDGLDRPRDALEILRQLEERMNQADSSKQFIESAMPSWINQIGVELSKDLMPTDEAEKVHELGSRLIGKNDVSASLDTMLLLTAIHQGPPYSETIKNSAEKIVTFDNAVNRVYSIMIQLESAAMDRSPERVGEFGKVRELKQLMEKPSQMSQTRTVIPSHYILLLNSLAAWHSSRDSNAAAACWDALRQDGVARGYDPRSKLGKHRCEWISNTLLALVKQQSVVQDSEVIKRRYFNGETPPNVSPALRLIDEADWWIERSPNSTMVTENIAIERFLIDLTKPGFTKMSLPSGLKKRLVPPNPIAVNGQLYRAAYELSLARKSDDWTLKYAVACLDIGLGERDIDSRSWIETFLHPTMVLIREDRPRLESLDTKTMKRFAHHFYKTKDGPFALAAMSRSSGNGQKGMTEADWIRGMEISASFLARSETDNNQKRDYLITAAEFLQRQKMSLDEPWDESSLEVLGQYLAEAKKVAPNDPEVAVLDSSLRFYKSNASKDLKTKVENLTLASNSLRSATEQLEKTDNKKALFNACYRRANCLVALARYERHDEKEILLKQARQSSQQAIDLIRDKPDDLNVKENAAFINLGNACEDLAYYCSANGSEQQKKYYYDAIEAFKQASSRAVLGASMKENFYLARCRHRSMGANKNVAQINQMLDDLNDYDESASPPIKVEWLGWRAKFCLDLGKIENAIDDCEKAIELVRVEQSHFPEDTKGELANLYVGCLNARCGKTGLCESGAALTLLDQRLATADGELYWKLLYRKCETLTFANEKLQLLETLEEIPREQFESLDIEPLSVSEIVLRLMIFLRNVGSPPFLGSSEVGMDKARAKLCGDRILREMGRYASSLKYYPSSQKYFAFSKVLVQSMSDDSVAKRIKAFVDVLPKETEQGELNSEILFLVRLALYNQAVQVIRAKNVPDRGSLVRGMINGVNEIDAMDGFKTQMGYLLDSWIGITSTERENCLYLIKL